MVGRDSEDSDSRERDYTRMTSKFWPEQVGECRIGADEAGMKIVGRS